MTVTVRHKETGETLEVLAFTGDDYVFVSPPGRPEEGRLVLRDKLDPDPRLEALRRGFTPWTNFLTARP